MTPFPGSIAKAGRALRTLYLQTARENRVDKCFVFEAPQLQDLIEGLHSQGYTVVGPHLRQGDLIYAELRQVADLPVGWRDEEDGGFFHLGRGEDPVFFGCRVGQHSWKQFLFPADLLLWQAHREEKGWRVEKQAVTGPPYAFLGVRACDLAGLAVHDRVFALGRYPDPIYRQRREQVLIVAVNCTRCGGTCFCASLGTGPRAISGFDLALTEILESGRHFFLAEVGSERGADLLKTVTQERAREDEVAAAARLIKAAAQNQARSLDTKNLKEFLYANYDNPQWEVVTQRCLTCGNCALTCPTCFCHNYLDSTEVNGQLAERRRQWETCFTVDHSYIHGGAIRPSPRSRYRQWLTHKLATWVDQFGCLGCIGCGRCITWCPVGIDLTEEVCSLKAKSKK